MSGAEEQFQSDSEVSFDSAAEESETSPIQPLSPNVPNGKGITNGKKTPPERPAPEIPAPPRDDSPLLLQLLTQPSRVYPPVIVTSPLQASTSQAVFIPGGAGDSSDTNVGNVSVSVPGIAPAPVDVLQASSSSSAASLIPGVGETSNPNVGNAPVMIPLPEDVGAGVPAPEDVEKTSTSLASNNPEVGETSSTNVGNAPVMIPLPEDVGAGVPAPEDAEKTSTSSASNNPEVGETSSTNVGNAPVMIPLPEDVGAGAPAPEDVQKISTSSASINPEVGEISKTEGSSSLNIPLPEVVEASGSGVMSVPEAVEASNPGITPAEGESIPEIKPTPEVDVPGAIPSSEAASSNAPSAEVVRDNTPEYVSIVETGSCVSETGADAGKIHDLEAVSSKEVNPPADLPASEAPEAVISEAVQIIDAKVSDALQSTIARGPSAVISADVEKAPKDENASEMVKEVSLAQDLVPETGNEGKSEPKPESSDEYSQASTNLEDAMKTSESPLTSTGSGQTSKSTEEAREVSKPQKYSGTASEPSPIPELKVEPMDTSETSGSGQTLVAKQEPGKIDAMDAEKSPVKRLASGRLDDLKSDDTNSPKSPCRRSVRLNQLKTVQSTPSVLPSPRKERKTVRSATLERVPSDDKVGVRTRARRVGSTSSNSEMEGSGDEVKAKRVSRKDSKK